MNKGFVFGKFLPFHKGHEVMIRFALSQCDFLSVLVCASDKETISGEKRKEWIEKTFHTTQNIEFLVFDYNESEYPNSSESSRDISEKWAEAFKLFFPDYTTVITSEPYGYYVAEYMNIKHILFDINREKIPVAASKIRSDIFTYWNYLPDPVKSDMAIKIAILGTESTGKTTMVDMLSKHYNCTSVFEAGRDLIADSTDFRFDDLYVVADEHARRIRKAEKGLSPLIIIDTDIHITKSYAQFSFNRELIVKDVIYEANEADLYLYLKNDVPHIQDGTRMNEEGRNRLDVSHRKTLANHNIPIIEISGKWEERFEKAVKEIGKLIGKKNKEVKEWI